MRLTTKGRYAVTAMLEHRAADSDAPDGVPQVVPLLDDVADPCLRW